MAKKRIAINGFGRIGRAAARIILADHPELELVAFNDPSDPKLTEYLFAYDSNFGKYPGEVKLSDDSEYLIVDGKKIRNFTTRNIEDLPWGDLKIDVVLECTGVFRTAEGAGQHLAQGAKKVIISAPAKSDGFETVVMGVNESETIGDAVEMYSNASCTTNCLAPVVKTLNDAFGIETGVMTTIHAYTNDQRLLDVNHKDMRRARAAAVNMIPTSTGAAKAIGKVIPALNGKLTGISIRVPIPTVSLVDFVAQVKTEGLTKEDINEALKKVSAKMPHILGVTDDPVVSKDLQGDPRSSIVDLDQTMVVGNQVKVLAWYDNEWGYANRLVELTNQI